MWSIFFVLIAGIAVGTFFNWNEVNKKRNERFQTAGVMLLLFTMGVGIGIDENLIAGIWEMGAQALAFAVATSLFSILFVYLLSNLLAKGSDAK